MSDHEDFINERRIKEEIPSDLYSFFVSDDGDPSSSLLEQQQAFLLAQQQQRQRHQHKKEEQKQSPLLDHDELPELIQASDDEVLQQHLIAQEIALAKIRREHENNGGSFAKTKPPPATKAETASSIVPREVFSAEDFLDDPNAAPSWMNHHQDTRGHSLQNCAAAVDCTNDNEKPNKESVTTSVTTVDDEDQEAVRLAEQRVALGQCPSCGEQLYKLTKAKGRNNNMNVWSKLWGFNSSANAASRKNGENSNNSAVEAPRDNKGVLAQPGEESIVRKKPLHIPGVVHRGQCVKCSTANDSNDQEGEEEPNVFLQDDEFEEDEYLQNSILNPLLVDNKNASKIHSSPTVSIATYDGAYNDFGERHGSGILKWSNGNVYEGNFVSGQRHGPGKLTYGKGHSAAEYVGDWENNHMHGQGTLRFKNGDLYSGPYVHGKRQGQGGRFYFANGDLFVGNWKDDTIDGFGRYYYHHGQRFEGEFVRGKRHGKGVLQRPDCSVEVYRYVDNVRVNPGVRWSPDRLSAWKLLRRNNASGRSIIKAKKISIAEAVSIGYEIENVMESQTANAHQSDCPNVPQGTTV